LLAIRRVENWHADCEAFTRRINPIAKGQTMQKAKYSPAIVTADRLADAHAKFLAAVEAADHDHALNGSFTKYVAALQTARDDFDFDVHTIIG
jgi:hypothetical protein